MFHGMRMTEGTGKWEARPENSCVRKLGDISRTSTRILASRKLGSAVRSVRRNWANPSSAASKTETRRRGFILDSVLVSEPLGTFADVPRGRVVMLS